MKRRFMLISAIALFLFVPLSATWAVWEGNAGIAASSEFPGSGMFARSDMFPKNTIVEIQNLETDITVRAIITGSAGMPGLVAVLSPETASALNIASGSVCRVRISIPSPIAERSAEGTSVSPTGTENRDPDVNPAVAADTAKTVNLEAFGEDSSDQLVPLDSPASTEVPAAAPVAAAPVSVPVAESVPETEAPVTESPVAQVPPETSPEPAVAEVASEPTPEPVAVEPTPEVTPEVTPEPAVAEVASEPTPEPTVADTAPEPTVEPVAVEAVPTATAENAPSIPEETAATAIAAEPETPEEAVTVSAGESVPVAEENSSGVSYEEPEVTIIPEPETESEVSLVPAEANPPEPVAEKPIADVPVAEPIAPQVAVVEPKVPVAEPAVAEPIAEPSVAKTPSPAIVAPIVAPVAVELPSTGPAKKGQIYIQIASYADSANVKKVIDAYGKKYPYVLEKSIAKKGEVTKILIGPVGKDEYGAVLERFKKFGFKDAFVKKVN